jgi:hypothetical protein
MSHTPIPTPFPQEIGYAVICDGCLNSCRVRSQGDLPIGWYQVYVYGWVGAFHACSGLCEEKIIKLHEDKSVPRFPIILINK